jgi:hypothetical protein
MNSLRVSRRIVASAASAPLAALAIAACGGGSERVTAFGAAWFAVSCAGQVVSRPASRPGGGSIY